MRRKNDILLKSAFEEIFPDLLRFFFSDADLVFDMERGFEFMDKELLELFPELEKNGGSRFVDMLVKTYLPEGEEKWMLIHIEIQAKNDIGFGKRMFQYFYRIFDRYDVPITALAVFTGGQGQTGCCSYHYKFLGTSLTYHFNVYQIFDHCEKELLNMENPFGLVILAAQKACRADQVSETQLGEQRLRIARAFIEHSRYDLERIRRFLFFLKTFLYIESSEINSIFDNEIGQLTGDRKAMGIIETIKMITREEALEEGIEKGIERGFEKGVEKGIEKGIERGFEKGVEKGKLAVATNLLSNTNFSLVEIAKLADVDMSDVQNLASKIRGGS